jgi:hypothetical protein
MTKDKKIIFACAVRNCSSYIDSIYKNIEKLSKQFLSYKIIFVESDSQDNTFFKLSVLQSIDENVEVICLGNLEPHLPQRTDRIAFARNKYLETVENKYKDYDYLCVFDCDDRNIEDISIDGFLSNFIYTNWDMICANQEKKYYDLWALRHPYWMPDDLIKKIYADKPPFISQEDANNMYSHSKRIHIDKKHPPFQVQSAFGGMALIKINSIQGSRHHGHYDNGWPLCEWVPFCLGLNKGNNNILINPAFINGKGDE